MKLRFSLGIAALIATCFAGPACTRHDEVRSSSSTRKVVLESERRSDLDRPPEGAAGSARGEQGLGAAPATQGSGYGTTASPGASGNAQGTATAAPTAAPAQTAGSAPGSGVGAPANGAGA